MKIRVMDRFLHRKETSGLADLDTYDFPVLPQA
jgi:hypothetical protein